MVIALFCALLDGVCLSRNKRITYLLVYYRQKYRKLVEFILHYRLMPIALAERKKEDSSVL